MRAVGIKQLKNKLSEYVRLAAQGERIFITDRDRIVAELSAPAPGVPQSVEDVALLELAKRGVIRPAIGAASAPPRAGGRKYTLQELLEQHDNDRSDR